MDRFDAMRAFIRIVERRSFTPAAQDIGLPRSTITQTIKQLEARLGVRLLQRTTRSESLHPIKSAFGSKSEEGNEANTGTIAKLALERAGEPSILPAAARYAGHTLRIGVG